MSRFLTSLPTWLLAATLATAILAGCSSDPSPEPTATPTEVTTASPTAAARVTITLGHCFVETVDFDGERWNVPFDDQFGWGGLEPDHWTGEGVMERTGRDRARFLDDGGAEVVFLPVNAPAVRPVAQALCD